MGTETDAIIHELVHGSDEWSKDWADNHPAAIPSWQLNFDDIAKTFQPLVDAFKEMGIIVLGATGDLRQMFKDLMGYDVNRFDYRPPSPLLAAHRRRRHK